MISVKPIACTLKQRVPEAGVWMDVLEPDRAGGSRIRSSHPVRLRIPRRGHLLQLERSEQLSVFNKGGSDSTSGRWCQRSAGH